MRPCMTCGELTDLGPRCDQCRPAQERSYARAPKTSSASRGYDAQWRRLSERARRLQPWCTDCGSPEDLTADHSTEAWRRRENGLPIRLRDVDVLCRGCNSAKGDPRTQGDPGGLGCSPSVTTLAVEAKFRSHTPGGYA